MTADTPETDWKAVAPASWDADYASLWARLQQAAERATKWHACFKEASAERDAALARAERLEADCEAAAVAINEMKAERDALVRVADAARAVGVFDKATMRLAQALDALPPGLGQSEGGG